MELRAFYNQKQSIVVTGATGFIGNRLLNLLGNQNFIPIDIETINAKSTVIHLAGNVKPTRDALLANIAMDSYIVDLVNERHAALIYASTNNVYQKAIDCRIDEITFSGDYYSLSKVIGEKLITNNLKKQYSILRIGDVFGIGQRHGNFFKSIETSLISREPLKLYGLGLKRRGYIHIDELCNKIKYIVDNIDKNILFNSIFNISYKDHASINEILEHVSEISGIPIISCDMDNDQSYLDIRTMEVNPMIGYQPIWNTFREALSAYVLEVSEK